MARVTLTKSLEAIRRCIEERRYDDGAAIARVVLGEYPHCVQARRILGEALWENDLADEAQAAFSVVLELDPEDFVSYAGLGLIAEHSGSLDQALSHLRRASELAPHSEEVRGELIRLYQRTGQADSGKLKISRAALARIYARSEMPSRALAEFQAVLHDEPDRIDVRLGLAEALWREGQAAEAKAECETVLQYRPQSIKANLIMAAALQAEGLGQHADQVLQQAALADPLGEYAQRIFGADAPLPPADPTIEVPAYLLGLTTAGDAGDDLDLELPDWLLEQEPPAESHAEEAPVDSVDEPESGTVIEFAPPETEPAAVEEPDAPDTDEWLESLPPSTRPAPSLDDAAVEAALAEAETAYREQGVEAALPAFAPLVEAEQALERVIEALTGMVAEDDNLDALELLGDACARAGRHREALEAYHRVLQKLDS